MTFKRILAGSFIIMICVMMFLNGYTRVTSSYCYADATTDQWTQVTTNQQLVEAFRYYCKSRDLTIDGSVANAVTRFTTKTFNGLCNTLGIDVTALQAQLKYQTDVNLGNRFLFTALGIDAYNRIFAQFLQDNNLEVGDENIDKTVFDGKTFDGYPLWVLTSADNSILGTSWSKVLYQGSYYLYDMKQLTAFSDGSNVPFPSFNYSRQKNYQLNGTSGSVSQVTGYYLASPGGSNAYNYMFNGTYYTGSTATVTGYPIVAYVNNNTSNVYLYLYSSSTNTANGRGNMLRKLTSLSISSNDIPDTTIYIRSTVINNNIYEGDTIINNNGTPTTNDPIPDDPEVPGYDPYPGGGGTTTPDDNVGGGDQSDDTNVTFPNFEFNFPEIDWSIGDLSDKFPFSIPFDLIAFFTVLNAEPEAPKIDANIPLGNWYTWHFVADFSQFDRYASIVRHVEFISFVVALIYLTIRLVKG